MSIRNTDLPLLPGYSFNSMIGRTRFNMDPKFDFIGPGNRALVEKVKPRMFGPLSDKYPSIYPRGEVMELPSWIAFDKHILRFDGFFQETLQEMPGAPFQIRKVKIYFFLEDGTIQVVEPKVENSGVAQGTLICRQRIRFPPPMDANFYDILDFNIGREMEFYGRVFKITDCDAFTRNFLNRCGIAVPDPITTPVDPFMQMRNRMKEGMLPKKPRAAGYSLKKFLQYDKKVLTFKAYWDDRKTEYGYVHHLELNFYLADDTIEIREVQAEAGGEPGFLFLKRSKLPKHFENLPQPGESANFTVLNVLSHRFLLDPLNEKQTMTFYAEKDLSIGSTINCYGRDIVIIDCDDFTKEYYGKKYGINVFTPLPMPKEHQPITVTPPKERELPPWNGFGSYEDSAQNCVSVELKAPFKNFKKFLKYDRHGLDSHILRFDAKMVSKIPENNERSFILSYYLADDTLAIFEVASRNSGFKTSQFLSRTKVFLPGEKLFTSKSPPHYQPQHMFIGANLLINGFHFILVGADEYALRYMEVNAFQYPKANINLIMDKVREKLRPIYKKFVADNIPNESSVITYGKLRDKLYQVMSDDFSEHEMVTISRAFSANSSSKRFSEHYIRALALTEMKKALWTEIDLERFREYLLIRDPHRTGRMSEKDCYTVVKACRLPFDKELIDKIFKVIKRDDHCNLYYEELLLFLDSKHCPMADVPPINIKHELQCDNQPETDDLIDWYAFNKFLDLESTFNETPGENTIEVLEKTHS